MRSVIVATGLMTLVDDCIKERFQSEKTHRRIPVPLRSKTTSFEYNGPRGFGFVQNLFTRRNSADPPATSSPLRYAQYAQYAEPAVAAY